MITLWPIYFQNSTFKIKKKDYTVSEIYNKWVLPTNDMQLFESINCIDYSLFRLLKKPKCSICLSELIKLSTVFDI